jgi:hypothetical protein
LIKQPETVAFFMCVFRASDNIVPGQANRDDKNFFQSARQNGTTNGSACIVMLHCNPHHALDA